MLQRMCYTAHLFPSTKEVRASYRSKVSKCQRTVGIAVGVATGCEMDARGIGVQSTAQIALSILPEAL
jgi:hypothetical protein